MPLPPLDHLATLSDDTGVIQHATHSVPNRSSGYCTDDVARAFTIVCERLRMVPRDERAARLAATYLSFLHDAQLDDGRFHNFMAYDRTWLDDAGSQDSWGRAMWALGYGAARAPEGAWRSVCATLLERSMQAIDGLTHLRSRAYAMLGLAHAYEAQRETSQAAALEHLGDALVRAFSEKRAADWTWFETTMTYDNPRMCEALLRAGRALGNEAFGETGLVTLQFYESVTIEGGIFVPIGNDGWYRRGGKRARYAQQPLEACALVDAELAAAAATGDALHAARAHVGLAWYYGKNSRGVVMARGGGCCDGLQENAVNPNMGAESTLALLSAAYAMARRPGRTLRAVR